MAQTAALISTLKKVLKTHGETYADVAKCLDLSEASVKRLFSDNNISLQRLDQICQMLNMEISDLVQAMKEERRQITQLTEEQETQIAGDLTLLLVAVCVLNRWSMDDITSWYKIKDTDCIRKLVQLDRLKLIELLPGNKIKLLVAPDFSWQPAGPIQQFFLKYVESDFFNSQFIENTEKLICFNGMLSDTSNAAFQRKMERLAEEFNEFNNDDAGLSIHDRHGTTLVVALRQWEYGLFSHLCRDE